MTEIYVTVDETELPGLRRRLDGRGIRSEVTEKQDRRDGKFWVLTVPDEYASQARRCRDCYFAQVR